VLNYPDILLCPLNDSLKIRKRDCRAGESRSDRMNGTRLILMEEEEEVG